MLIVIVLFLGVGIENRLSLSDIFATEKPKSLNKNILLRHYKQQQS